MTPAAALSLLRAAGVEAPLREVRLLLAAAPEPALFAAAVARRAAREPLAFIRGCREFWSLTLRVSRATLIPRPESETLVEAALGAFPDRTRPLRVLDLGTGTGCLLLAVLSEFPAAFGVGVDRSFAAAALARENAVALGFGARCVFGVADWATCLGGPFDLVLANPPYVPRAEIGTFAPEVARYEPLAALDGGPDGCAAYRQIFADLARLLAPREAIAVCELGQGGAGSVSALARAAGLVVADVRRDLSGIPRALVLRPCHEKTVWQARPR